MEDAPSFEVKKYIRHSDILQVYDAKNQFLNLLSSMRMPLVACTNKHLMQNYLDHSILFRAWSCLLSFGMLMLMISAVVM